MFCFALPLLFLLCFERESVLLISLLLFCFTQTQPFFLFLKQLTEDGGHEGEVQDYANHRVEESQVAEEEHFFEQGCSDDVDKRLDKGLDAWFQSAVLESLGVEVVERNLHHRIHLCVSFIILF